MSTKSFLAQMTVSSRENRVTYMLFTVSVFFIVLLLPYLVIKIVQRYVYENGPEFELSPSVQFALNLVYMNNVFNPFVYYIFNQEFRRFVRCLVKRVFAYLKIFAK